jgi:hypothetical protein
MRRKKVPKSLIEYGTVFNTRNGEWQLSLSIHNRYADSETKVTRKVIRSGTSSGFVAPLIASATMQAGYDEPLVR